MNSSRGMTIISEALLAIGTILVAVAFVFVGGNIIDLQSEGLFSSTQNQVSQELSSVINGLPESGGSFSTTYEPSVNSYTLTVQEQRTVVVKIPGEESSSTTFLDHRLENTRVSDSDQICVSKTGSKVNFSEGECGSGGLSNFCTDGRCVNDICQPDKGETCSNSQGDCLCPGDAESDEASEVCDPDYEAEDFINADTSGEDTTGLGCVKKSYTDVQAEGEKCSQSFECSADLSCSGPHYTASGVSGDRCCPQGSSWNGTECKDNERYNIVFTPARYSDQGNFESDAEDAFNYFVSKSPFKQCSNPDHNIKKTVLDISSCNIDNCDVSTGDSCFNKMKQCANSQLGVGNWNKIIGLAKGDGPQITYNGQTGMICGKAQNIPSPVSVTYSSCDVETASHETGHSTGLYHVSTPGNNEGGACQGPNSEDCNEPESDRRNFLMSYSNQRNQYGPAGYSYMEQDVFDSYLGGC